MPLLPNDADFIGDTVDEAAFKAKQAQMLGYLRGLLGSDGAAATALAQLGINNAPVRLGNIENVVGTDGTAATARQLLGLGSLTLDYIDRGAWATNTLYHVNDQFTQAGIAYLVTKQHTSTVFSTDATSGFFVIQQGLNHDTGLQKISGVAALRTIIPTAWRSVYCDRHTRQGDGGHGVFRAVTGKPAGYFTDDNGTIFVTTGGDGSTAWVREVESGVFQAEWWGLVGDGITDDAPAFTASALAASAAGITHIIVNKPNIAYFLAARVVPATLGGNMPHGIQFVSFHRDIQTSGERIYIDNIAANTQKLCYGTYNNSVASTVYANSGDKVDVSNVMGIFNPWDVSTYSARDTVGLFVGNTAQPLLLSSINTTFTANTVTTTDLTPAIIDKLRRGMLIDIPDQSGALKATGTIKSWTNTTITVDTAWYIVDSITPATKLTVVPIAGATIQVNPQLYVWCNNSIMTIAASSHASGGTGFELDVVNNKAGTGGATIGYSAVSLGIEQSYAGFISKGNFTTGYESRAKIYGLKANDLSSGGHKEVGVWCATDGTQAGSRFNFYAQSGKVNYNSSGAKAEGFLSSNDSVGVRIKSSTNTSLDITSGTYIGHRRNDIGQSMIDNHAIQTITVTNTAIGQAGIIQIIGNINAILPNAAVMAGRIFRIKAIQGTATLTSNGGLINGLASYSITSSKVFDVYSDGNGWAL